MTILEKEVLVSVGGSNIKHFESLGYEIPRWKDTRSQMSVKRGTKILVKVEDLLYGHTIVTKICDDCGKHIPNQTISSIKVNRNKSDGKDRCFDCGRQKAGNTIITNVPFEKSLEYFAINSKNKQYLLFEYSIKNKQKANELYKNSKIICWWNCPDCKSEYDMSVVARVSGENNCPFCRGLRVNETNSLWSVNSEVAKLLSNPEDGHKVTNSSAKKCKFTCPECGYIEKKVINSVVTNGFCCPRCSDNISYPEKLMMSVLNQLNIKYKREKYFKWSKKITHSNDKLSGDKRYDFYISSLNCIIETHGLQHYKQTFNHLKDRDKSLEEEIENDQLKERLARDNGIDNYIVIDCRFSDFAFIKNNIVNSELSELFDLSEVNWIECDNWTISSYTKLVCEMWNKGNFTAPKIAKILNIGRSTAHRHLKKGAELGWCNYVPEIGGINKREVVQLTLNGEFIREWESALKAVTELGINLTGVSDACSGRLKTSGGYRWVFKENYNSQQEIGRGKIITYNKKPVVQLTLNNKYIKTWDSATDAGRELGILRSNIQSACSGEYQQSNGFRWMYRDDYERNKNNLNTDDIKRKGKSIVQLDLKGIFIKEYERITDASVDLGITGGNISQNLTGKTNSAYGFKWMYKEDYEKLVKEQNKVTTC